MSFFNLGSFGAGGLGGHCRRVRIVPSLDYPWGDLWVLLCPSVLLFLNICWGFFFFWWPLVVIQWSRGERKIHSGQFAEGSAGLMWGKGRDIHSVSLSLVAIICLMGLQWEHSQGFFSLWLQPQEQLQQNTHGYIRSNHCFVWLL